MDMHDETILPAPRFRIRHLGMWLLILCAAALIAGGLAIGWPYAREQRVVEMVSRHGGYVEYEWIGPAWLEGWVPTDYRGPLERITSVRLSGGGIDETGLSVLPNATRMRTLVVNHAPLTDAAFIYIGRCPQLDDLSLIGSCQHGHGLRYLKTLPHLRVLRVDQNPLDDNALEPLAEISTLKWVSLSYTPIGDEGVRHLSGLSEMRELNMTHTKVTDAGLSSLSGMPVLRKLILQGTPITDAGLKHLEGLQQLDTLDLDFTLVGDPGVESLAELSALADLHLIGTKVSDAGLPTLGKMHTLERLSLGRGHAQRLSPPDFSGEAVAAHLKSLHRLRYLFLQSSRVREESLQELTSSVPGAEIYFQQPGGWSRQYR
jgi:internalin A